MRSKRKNRRRVSTLDPQVYQTDRIGFLRGLRAIHRAADLGCDTSNSYLIVEYDRVVGVGGCIPPATAAEVPAGLGSRSVPAGGTSRGSRSGGGGL